MTCLIMQCSVFKMFFYSSFKCFDADVFKNLYLRSVPAVEEFLSSFLSNIFKFCPILKREN